MNYLNPSMYVEELLSDTTKLDSGFDKENKTQ